MMLSRLSWFILFFYHWSQLADFSSLKWSRKLSKLSNQTTRSWKRIFFSPDPPTSNSKHSVSASQSLLHKKQGYCQLIKVSLEHCNHPNNYNFPQFSTSISLYCFSNCLFLVCHPSPPPRNLQQLHEFYGQK